MRSATAWKTLTECRGVRGADAMSSSLRGGPTPLVGPRAWACGDCVRTAVPRPDDDAAAGTPTRRALPRSIAGMTTWEYSTIPLIVHSTKQILDQWGADGWELVQVVPGLNPENLVAYFKRPKA